MSLSEGCGDGEGLDGVSKLLRGELPRPGLFGGLIWGFYH